MNYFSDHNRLFSKLQTPAQPQSSAPYHKFLELQNVSGRPEQLQLHTVFLRIRNIPAPRTKRVVALYYRWNIQYAFNRCCATVQRCYYVESRHDYEVRHDIFVRAERYLKSGESQIHHFHA